MNKLIFIEIIITLQVTKGRFLKNIKKFFVILRMFYFIFVL